MLGDPYSPLMNKLGGGSSMSYPLGVFCVVSDVVGQRQEGKMAEKRESNPRNTLWHSHDFQSCPFGHSGISPRNVNIKDIRKTNAGQGETMIARENPAEHKSGFVAVAGRPNVGKSTLVNRIMRTELSIVTAKAQTTRNRITAIHTLSGAQMVLQDTPGSRGKDTLTARWWLPR